MAPHSSQFYSRRQDKSESRDTLNRGAPVVSLSIGDSADFHYSTSSREDMGELLPLTMRIRGD
eukprot:1181748-Prorocentrum_minimum.AAC.1